MLLKCTANMLREVISDLPVTVQELFFMNLGHCIYILDY